MAADEVSNAGEEKKKEEKKLRKWRMPQEQIDLILSWSPEPVRPPRYDVDIGGLQISDALKERLRRVDAEDAVAKREMDRVRVYEDRVCIAHCLVDFYTSPTSASTSSFSPAHLRPDHQFRRLATTTSATDRYRARVYAIKLRLPLVPLLRLLLRLACLIANVVSSSTTIRSSPATVCCSGNSLSMPFSRHDRLGGLLCSPPTLAYDSWWSPASPARYWQHRYARSSRVVPRSGKPGVTSRPSRFDYIGSSASPSSTTVVIVSPSSSPARPRVPLVHDDLPSVHDHSTTPLARLAARLPRHHRLPDFGYIDHGYSAHGFINHGSLGSFALATSTTA
ncbi:hypothetical protein OsI_27069 [Oryza sativa Indica Group]|uniref:Uncharacterized protein n=1 Tax=Oryza sativa subsp. indica TaxID=39946 RepID=B8B543_ORYSI|nr:hypothetical protein OsI_27069 [Oryza sativa Indica Group]